MFTLGANHRPATNLWWGAALSFGWYNNDASGVSLESSAVIGSVHVTRTLTLNLVGLRPYANLAYAKEFKDGPISVTAGSHTMPGRFTLSGFTPQRHWASADLGLVVSLYEKANVFAGYTGRYGSESRLDHRVNLGLGITF